MLSLPLSLVGGLWLMYAMDYKMWVAATVSSIRPKVITFVTTMEELVPIPWSTGTGSEVMQRIAVPMIGGMVSSTLLTLIVIPAIYAAIYTTKLKRFS